MLRFKSRLGHDAGWVEIVRVLHRGARGVNRAAVEVLVWRSAIARIDRV